MIDRAKWIKTLKVGSKVYCRDIYRQSFLEKYIETEITGETSRSWITYWDSKYPKKTAGGLWSQREVIELEWMRDNKFEIGDRVKCCDDYNVLKEIDRLLKRGGR